MTGKIQQPNKDIIIKPINTPIPNFTKKEPHFPNTVSNQSNSHMSCPAFLQLGCPVLALVKDSLDAVLLGMKVQHLSPNREHIPPLLASNISNAMRFCNGIRLVECT